MNRGRRNRLEGLIGIGLLGVSCLLASGLFVLLSQNNQQLAAAGAAPTSPAVATATPEPVEIWDAYEQAYTAVQAQAQDAQLVSASAQWQAPDEEALWAGAANWAFAFYSSANGRVLDVAVGPEKAWVVNQSQVRTVPQTLTEGTWQSGPRDPLLMFLAYGGREFLEDHAQATIDLHLGARQDRGLVWSIVALDIENQESLAVLIAADTMQVLSSTP